MEDFLDGLKIKKVNMMNNKEGAFKGFAYVEFEDKQSLVNVLELNGMVCVMSCHVSCHVMSCLSRSPLRPNPRALLTTRVVVLLCVVTEFRG